MSDNEVKYLDAFGGWLRTLGEDAELLGSVLSAEEVSAAAREAIAGGLNYLFKSLDLIPDGIDDIGYLDDAFVLRVAADLASQSDTGKVDGDKLKNLSRLANDCDMLRQFLDKDYGRLETYVKGLRRGAARGRAVSDIVGDQSTRGEFLSDVRGFAKSYEAPSFSREEKNLIKLRAFFDAKLPK